MFHGRDDNRLKSLKFSPVLLFQNRVDSQYAICMADLRNAGKSENGPSGMGYKTAADVYETMPVSQQNIRHEAFYSIHSFDGSHVNSCYA